LLDRLRQFEEDQFQLGSKESLDLQIPLSCSNVEELEQSIQKLKQEMMVKDEAIAKEALKVQKMKLSVQELEAKLASQDTKMEELKAELSSKLENSKAVTSLKGIVSRKNDLLDKLKAKLITFDPTLTDMVEL